MIISDTFFDFLQLPRIEGDFQRTMYITRFGSNIHHQEF